MRSRPWSGGNRCSRESRWIRRWRPRSFASSKARKKIEAIKVYRERTGVGLKEAKDAVEAVAAQRGIVAPSGFGVPGRRAASDGSYSRWPPWHWAASRPTMSDMPTMFRARSPPPRMRRARSSSNHRGPRPLADEDESHHRSEDRRHLAQEKIKVADLNVGMWVRAEMVGDVATRIVAGHLWLEDGERLVLFKGLPEEFFTHPAGFDVNNVPTKFGPLRMMYRLTGNGSYLRWGRKAPAQGRHGRVLADDPARHDSALASR